MGTRRMGMMAFLTALAVCVASMAIAGCLWFFAKRSRSDWTAPRRTGFDLWARRFLALSAFTGLCAFALYGWTYLGAG